MDAGTSTAEVVSVPLVPSVSRKVWSPVRKADSTCVAVPENGSMRPSLDTEPTVRPSCCKTARTAEVLVSVGPKRAANAPAGRYWWNRGDEAVVTALMNEVSAPGSRGRRATAPVIRLAPLTAPSSATPATIWGPACTCVGVVPGTAEGVPAPADVGAKAPSPRTVTREPASGARTPSRQRRTMKPPAEKSSLVQQF